MVCGGLELWNCDVVRYRLEDNLYGHADRNMPGFAIDHLTDQPHAFIKLDHGDYVRHRLLEAGHQYPVNRCMRINLSFTTGLDPVEAIRQTISAQRPWIKLNNLAVRAALKHQFMILAGGPVIGCALAWFR